MSELEDQIRALQEIREKKKEILDQESQARERIIQLAGTDKYMSVGDITLDVSSKDRLKIVDPESVPNFLKSNLPDQQRINEYFRETGHVPAGVELTPVTYVKVIRDKPEAPLEPKSNGCSYCGSQDWNIVDRYLRTENNSFVKPLEFMFACTHCYEQCDICGYSDEIIDESVFPFSCTARSPHFDEFEKRIVQQLDPEGGIRRILGRDVLYICKSCESSIMTAELELLKKQARQREAEFWRKSWEESRKSWEESEFENGEDPSDMWN